MPRPSRALPIIALLLPAIAAPAHAATPREVLTEVAFGAYDRNQALVRVQSTIAASTATLTHQPRDRDARLELALATSYRAKLTRSRSDALSARAQFESLAASAPDDAEAQAALGSWHFASVTGLGAFMARAALGARRAVGTQYLDRAVALGGDRAMFLSLAGLFRLEADPTDATGLRLVRAAVRGSAPTPIDRILQRRTAAIVALLPAGNGAAIQAAARRALPMGWAD